MGITCPLQRRQKAEGRRGYGQIHRATLALGGCSKGQGSQGRKQRMSAHEMMQPYAAGGSRLF